MARGLLLLGLALTLAGLLLVVVPGAFSWIGRLPGDLRVSVGRTRIFIPLATMTLLSLVLSLLLTLLARR